MGKEVLGKITCPLCGNKNATVHQQASRSAKLYYRCMDGDQGPCGTIQCTLSRGQQFIRENMRPLDAGELAEVVHEAAELAKESQQKAAQQQQPKKRTSILDAFFSDED